METPQPVEATALAAGPQAERKAGEAMIQLPTSEKYECRIKAVVVVPNGEPIFGEVATTISIDDEAAGEFVNVSQQGGHTKYEKHLLIDPNEWPIIRDAIDLMIGQCRKDVN